MAERIYSAKPAAYSYIRMSTAAQLKGRSLDRQLEISGRYAEAHGLRLVDDFKLADIGVSAFKGANVKSGALGRFLAAVERQDIAPGSYLLVESLDRLSRQEVLPSLSLFIQIINAGIVIVTLMDDRIFTREKANELDLITSIIIMSRAHDESRAKSQRIRDVWAHRRANAGQEKISGTCPAWLKLSHDRKSFEVIGDRAETVRRLFEESASGIGNYAITRRLNAEKIAHFGKSDGWQNSYVAKILNNRAVLGEFQPHKLVGSNSVAVGVPLKNYYPQIVSDELFYRAQNGRRARGLGVSAGRRGDNVRNLFSHLALCAYCGAHMKFENKGRPPKGSTFLVCDRAKRGFSCPLTRWRYTHFEASFLSFVSEIDLASLVQSERNQAARNQLDNEIVVLRGQLASVEVQQKRILDLYAEAGGDRALVVTKIRELEEQSSELERQIVQKEALRAQMTSNIKGFQESKDQIKTLITLLQDHDGEDVYRLRAQIADKLKSLISSIRVATIGNKSIIGRQIDDLKSSSHFDEETTSRLIHSLEEELTSARSDARYFSVIFKDGTSRDVFPNDGDPLGFDAQIVASSEKWRLIDSDWSESYIDFRP